MTRKAPYTFLLTSLLSSLTPLAPAALYGPIIQWVDDPTTSATVRWLTKESAAAAPEGPWHFTYRRTDETAWREAVVTSHRFGPAAITVRGVQLAGLQPGTRYLLRIAYGDKVLDEARFVSAPAVFTEGMSFVTGGDMFHTRPLLDAMNRRAGAEAPLFALLGGDLAYGNASKASKWLGWFDSWREEAVAPDGRLVPMVVAIGNHEVKGIAYKPADPPPRDAAPYYYTAFAGQEQGARTTVDFGDYLSIVTLDSGHTASIDSQTAWLEKVLAARAHMPRLFVCYHRPAYGTGVKKDAVKIRTAWSPLFERYRVDGVFENDHHVYKRTHPLTAGEIDPANGVPYLGDGSWGVRVRRIREEWRITRPWLAAASATNHLIKVTMTRDGFRFEGMTAAGDVFDHTTRPLRRR